MNPGGQANVAGLELCCETNLLANETITNTHITEASLSFAAENTFVLETFRDANWFRIDTRICTVDE